MIKIYYNPQTGEITELISGSGISFNNGPYIEIDKRIKINEWKVDLETKTLVKI